MECYSAIEKNETLPFTMTWMELEGIMLSEISQRKQIPYDFTQIWNLRNRLNEQRKKRQTKTETLTFKLVVTRGEVVWRMGEIGDED